MDFPSKEEMIHEFFICIRDNLVYLFSFISIYIKCLRTRFLKKTELK